MLETQTRKTLVVIVLTGICILAFIELFSIVRSSYDGPLERLSSGLIEVTCTLEEQVAKIDLGHVFLTSKKNREYDNLSIDVQIFGKLDANYQVVQQSCSCVQVPSSVSTADGALRLLVSFDPQRSAGRFSHFIRFRSDIGNELDVIIEGGIVPSVFQYVEKAGLIYQNIQPSLPFTQRGHCFEVGKLVLVRQGEFDDRFPVVKICNEDLSVTGVEFSKATNIFGSDFCCCFISFQVKLADGLDVDKILIGDEAVVELDIEWGGVRDNFNVRLLRNRELRVEPSAICFNSRSKVNERRVVVRSSVGVADIRLSENLAGVVSLESVHEIENGAAAVVTLKYLSIEEDGGSYLKGRLSIGEIGGLDVFVF